MFLKNEYYILYLLTIIVFLFNSKVSADSNDKNIILNHLNSLKYFSASFLQNDGENLSEGKVYIGKKRVRAEYFSPTKILIILSENKGMYYNYELDEDEFFNPKNTNAWFFYDIFRNTFFFEDSLIESKNNYLTIKKNGLNKDGDNYFIKVYFEKNPLVLRKVDVLVNENLIQLSLYNHNYNEEFDKNFFKLINPKFFD